MLRRKKVLALINKEKLVWLINHSLMPNISYLKRTSPLLLPNKAELPCGLHVAKSLSNAQRPKQSFQKSGITKDRQRPKTTGNFSKYQTNRPKIYRSFHPNKASQTKTQHLLRKDERKSPQSLKSYMLDIKSLSTLFQLQNVQI